MKGGGDFSLKLKPLGIRRMLVLNKVYWFGYGMCLLFLHQWLLLVKGDVCAGGVESDIFFVVLDLISVLFKSSFCGYRSYFYFSLRIFRLVEI